MGYTWLFSQTMFVVRLEKPVPRPSPTIRQGGGQPERVAVVSIGSGNQQDRVAAGAARRDIRRRAAAVAGVDGSHMVEVDDPAIRQLQHDPCVAWHPTHGDR